MRVMWSFLCVLLLTFEVQAAPNDARFTILLDQAEVSGADLQAAVDLAVPRLWQRIVPVKDLARANALSAPTSLLLQFKSMTIGAKLVFNPSQVRIFLRNQHIDMILQQPYWNLSIHALGFSGTNDALSRSLLDYSYKKSAERGFRLGARGKKVRLIFTPAMNAAGDEVLHVELDGALTSGLLSQTDVKVSGYPRHQLQSFLSQVLFELRDAYRFEGLSFKETGHEVLLTVYLEHSLVTQVMLEQALSHQPQVVAMIPMTLQKVSRQYRIRLRDEDSSWLASWFAGYGLTAMQQQAGGDSEWFVHSGAM